MKRTVQQLGRRISILSVWEEAIYGEGRLTEEQKAEKRKSALKDF